MVDPRQFNPIGGIDGSVAAMKRLWQPPRLRQDDQSHERRATWLELFFDLVFVVTVTELGKVLLDDVSPMGLLHYALLFVPIWWCWVGETFYATRYDQDSLSDRLVTLVQMMILVVMAVNAHYGLDQSSVGFALCYVAFRSILLLQYTVAGWFNPQTRLMVRHFRTGFGLSVMLWLAAIVVPAPWRFGLWILGLAIDFLTPLMGRRYLAQFPPNMTHVPERLGLFTMIMLGESLFAVVTGLSKQEDWTLGATMIAVLGVVNAFVLWWMYFETASGSPFQTLKLGLSAKLSPTARSTIWLYAHLPLAIGVTAAGVGVKYALSKAYLASLSDAGRWLLCGSMGLTLVTLALLHWLTCLRADRRRSLIGQRFAGVGALAIVGLLGQGLSSLSVVGLVAAIGLVQVTVDIVQQDRAAQG
jgi:low temperature requirement protein LtrA